MGGRSTAMISTRFRRAAAFVLPVVSLAVLSAGCDIVTADLNQTATADWRKTYPLEQGGRVEISNVNGKIQVEPSMNGQVEVVAHKKGKGTSDEAAKDALARIEINEDVSGSAVRITTKTPSANGLFGGSTEVSYDVRVPAGADVRFTTVNGGVELSRLSGRIKAGTTNGGITAREVAGSVDASTTNGGVDVDLTKLDPDGVSLDTTNGGITLRLPADTRATISARVSNGGIDTNELQLETTASTRRRLEARLNGGGPNVRIETTNGGIRIRPR
jgi:DUF4097 and DUF4098 domain-containing protein YvlB